MLTRALLLIGFLVVFASPSWAGTYVQSCKSTAFAGGTSVTCALTGVTTGHGLAVFVLSGPAGSISSVSDGTNTYTTPAACADNNLTGMRYALNVTGGNLTITTTLSAAGNGFVVVQEFAGANTFDTCGGWNVQSAPGAGATVPSLSATVSASAFLAGATRSASGTNDMTEVAPWVNRQTGSDTSSSITVGSQDTVTAGSYVFSDTVATGSTSYISGFMSFKQVAGGTTCTGGLLLLGVGGC